MSRCMDGMMPLSFIKHPTNWRIVDAVSQARGHSHWAIWQVWHYAFYQPSNT